MNHSANRIDHGIICRDWPSIEMVTSGLVCQWHVHCTCTMLTPSTKKKSSLCTQHWVCQYFLNHQIRLSSFFPPLSLCPPCPPSPSLSLSFSPSLSSLSSVDELTRVQQHLNLLREQYVKLQQRHSDLEQKYTRAIATSGDATADHFVSRLLKMVADLYDKSLYRFDQFITFTIP